MRCLFCHNRLSRENQVKDFDSGKKYRLLKCNSCFVAYTFPRLNKKELLKKYNEYREEERGIRFRFIFDDLITRWHSRRPKLVSKILNKRGKVLDVGCGKGIELAFFKRNGWQVMGTELKNHNHSFPVFTKDVWDLNLRPNSFDLVMFLHSLEHLIYPNKALSSSKSLIKKGGLMLIAVPNYESMERRLFGGNWFHLDIPRHYSHFSKSFFQKWAKNNSFKIIKESHIAPEYDFYSFLQSSLNFLPFPKNLLYNFLLVKKNLSAWKKILLLMQLPFVLLFLSFLIIVPILWLFKQSGTIELILQKK